jgi:hypothetical protein
LQLYSTWDKDNEKNLLANPRLSSKIHSRSNKLMKQVTTTYHLKRGYDKTSSIFYTTTMKTYLKRDMHTSLTP